MNRTKIEQKKTKVFCGDENCNYRDSKTGRCEREQITHDSIGFCEDFDRSKPMGGENENRNGIGA